MTPRAIFTTRLLQTAVLSVATLAAGLAFAATDVKTIHMIPQGDLKILDTVQTTNNITSNHGYMIYDTLFALDSKLEAEAADGRELQGVADRKPLDVQAAPGPQVPRRPAGDGQGLRRLDHALCPSASRPAWR